MIFQTSSPNIWVLERDSKLPSSVNFNRVDLGCLSTPQTLRLRVREARTNNLFLGTEMDMEVKVPDFNVTRAVMDNIVTRNADIMAARGPWDGVDRRIRWRNHQAAPRWAHDTTNGRILLVETNSMMVEKINL